MTVETVSENKCFGGVQGIYRHQSEQLGCAMRFSVFRPPQAETEPMPVVWWLSGLTCTEENFTVKAGAQRYAAELGLMVVAPDTSPRGLDIPGEDEAYDFGSGAGFYLDATEDPWSANYQSIPTSPASCRRFSSSTSRPAPTARPSPAIPWAAMGR